MVKNLTPGPGQYQAASMAAHQKNKITSKGGVFGSTQRRFLADHQKVSFPGPGQYGDVTPKLSNKVTKSAVMKDQIKKSNSMYLKQKGHQRSMLNHPSTQLQAQSYIQQ